MLCSWAPCVLFILLQSLNNIFLAWLPNNYLDDMVCSLLVTSDKAWNFSTLTTYYSKCGYLHLCLRKINVAQIKDTEQQKMGFSNAATIPFINQWMVRTNFCPKRSILLIKFRIIFPKVIKKNPIFSLGHQVFLPESKIRIRF